MLGADRVIIRGAEDDGRRRSRLAGIRFLFGEENWAGVEVELVPPKVEPSPDEEYARYLSGWRLAGDKGVRYWVRNRIKIPRSCYPLRRRP